MFIGPETARIWEELKSAYSFGDRARFAKILRETEAIIKRDRDALRLLFFIGKEFDEPAYKAMLHMMADWRFAECSDDIQYCFETYLYTVRHTLSAKLQAEKPYLIPLFLDTTHFRETADPNVAPRPTL